MSPFMRRLANGSVPRADEHFKKLVRLVRLVRELHAFPENARGVLRHDGVDVEAGAPFESRGLREPRRDLEMPVVLGLLAVAGGRVDVIVEGRVVEDAEHPTQDVLEDSGERGALVVPMSCECGWEIDAPARSPWFLKIRMYLNRLSRIRSRYRYLYAVMISCTWNSLCMDRWCSCSGVSSMTSCAPTPFTLWNSWLTWRWTSPSTCRAGYLFGTHRIHHPGPFGTPSFR